MIFFINKTFFAIVVLFFLACNNNDSKEYNKQDILNIEQLRVDALLSNDIEILTEVMHPKAIHISSNGNRLNTHEWLEGRKKSSISFNSFTLNKDQEIRFYENIAIVDGSYTNSRRIGDSITPFKSARYTRVYVKLKGKAWQMITHQSTELNK